MILKNMEHHKNNLKDALSKLPSFQPADCIWTQIDRKLSEEPLENIESRIAGKKNQYIPWWYAAAILLTLGFAGYWYDTYKAAASVSYTQQVIDARLQTIKEPVTDQQYEKLISYCEAETVVCNDMNFKRLKQEYETLRSATDQLQKAMGSYNTEPELTRQFSIVEQQKAEVLNEMAKMI
jgi:exonuclease VII large subunit